MWPKNLSDLLVMVKEFHFLLSAFHYCVSQKLFTSNLPCSLSWIKLAGSWFDIVFALCLLDGPKQLSYFILWRKLKGKNKWMCFLIMREKKVHITWQQKAVAGKSNFSRLQETYLKITGMLSLKGKSSLILLCLSSSTAELSSVAFHILSYFKNKN